MIIIGVLSSNSKHKGSKVYSWLIQNSAQIRYKKTIIQLPGQLLAKAGFFLNFVFSSANMSFGSLIKM